MRKILTLALILIMALSVAVPALAFTSVEYSDNDTDIKLDIKLVDVSDGIVNINFNAPASTRGYVKNEVICAVVSMFVPKNEEIKYEKLVFSGTNVSLYSDENFYANNGGTGKLNHMSKNANDLLGANSFKYGNMSVDNEIILEYTGGLDKLEKPSKDQTYHFAVFGKVTGDDAWMKAVLKGDGGLINANGFVGAANNFNVVELKDDYLVGYLNPNEKAVATPGSAGTIPLVNIANSVNPGTIQLDKDDVLYYIQFKTANGPVNAATSGFAITTDKKYNCKAMYVYYNAAWHQVKIVGSNYENAQKISGWGVYVQFELLGASQTVAAPADAAIMARYIVEDIIWGEFKLNLNVNGQMKPEWWAKNKELSAEVQVEPWYAEVTVPPEIEIEAPKTGDMTTSLGFMLIAISSLVFSAVRKVRS